MSFHHICQRSKKLEVIGGCGSEGCVFVFYGMRVLLKKCGVLEYFQLNSAHQLKIEFKIVVENGSRYLFRKCQEKFSGRIFQMEKVFKKLLKRASYFQAGTK